MNDTEGDELQLHGDEEIIEVIELNETEPGPDEVADELEHIDVVDPNNNNEDCETEEEEEEEEEEEMEMAEAVQDDSELTFSKHTGAVFCVSLDPAMSSLAVTGGEDDRAFVWRVSDGEVLLECTGHKDSVTCAEFSHDSSMVASGDMSGVIKVWNVETKEEIWAIEVGDLEWLEWHPCAPVLLAGTDDGNVWMWKIPSGGCKTFQSSACRTTCGKVLPDGKQCVVGYEDGTVRVWDLKQGNAIHVLKGHDGNRAALTCVACNTDGSLAMTGSVDGYAKVICIATGKVVALFCAGEGEDSGSNDGEEEPNSVESVGFCNTLPLIAVAYLDGTLVIYDLPTQVQRHRCQLQTGIVHLCWEESAPMVTTCCLDGSLRLWDARSGDMVSEYRGHTAEILGMAVNREASLAVTASGDNKAKVFCLQRLDR